ncbi:Ribosome maturation factor RimM [Paraconexibacter sp. AEG42_29]|uniref:Ribosome maturation factor RimM n=1 Tax=Paraconexibacter sp. AEG42_29 TaxID=2997339 RepID=A0AAU7AUW2_9ACTN
MAAALDWLEAGRIGRPHGLDGSFYVTQPRPALLRTGLEVRVGEVDAEIVRRSGTDAKPILRLQIATGREAIEALRGEALNVPRAAAPPLEDDEWYATDLVGCAVVDAAAGVDVGFVRELMALPSCEALAVARVDGPELLVPLVKDCVRSVDVAAARIDIDLAFLGDLA